MHDLLRKTSVKKTSLNILVLVAVIAGMVNVVLGIFYLKNQHLIVFGCLLIALGTGLSYRNQTRNRNRTKIHLH